MNKSYMNFTNRWQGQDAVERLAHQDQGNTRIAAYENMLRETSIMFQVMPKSDMLRGWAEKLVHYKVEPPQLRQACELLHRRFDRFPSFKELMDIILPSTPNREEKQDLEAIRLNQTYAKYLKMFGEESMAKLGEAWLKNVAGINQEQIRAYGFTGKLFAKVACMDMEVVGIPKNKEEWAHFWDRSKKRHENFTNTL